MSKQTNSQRPSDMVSGETMVATPDTTQEVPQRQEGLDHFL